MTFKTYEINVDLVNDISTTSVIRFSQNDRNSAKLLLTITNKGAELDLSQAKSVRMSFKKPDGTRVFQNDCQPINAMKGKYQILLKTQTLTAVGNVIAQIHIEEEDRIIDTQKFFFIVNDSLASDEAVESTNDFTIIQKALELGEKFKNVDFDPIMAAGELAKGAVKKSGDTMTGNLTFQSDTEANILFRTKTTNQEYVKFYANPTRNRLGVYSTKNSKNVWDYDGDADSFNVNTNTNLLKKNEAFYTYAQPSGRTFQLREGDDLNNYLDTGLFAGPKLVNAPSQDYFYIEVIRYADANYTMQRATTLVGSTAGTWVRRKTGSTWNPWEKIMDQKGGTMTGQLDIQVPAAGSNGIAFKNTSGGDLHKFIGTNTGAVAWQDKVNNIDVFNYSAVNKTLTFLGDTNLVKKTGDIISGSMTMDVTTGQKRFVWAGNNINTGFNASDDPVSQNFSMVDYKNNRTIWTYEPLTNSLNFRGDLNVPWVRKTGDTITGHMIFRHNINQETADGLKGVNMVVNSSVNKWSVAPKMDGNPVWANEFAMDLNTGKVTVPSLATKKDGRADLALTADAELFTGNTVIADRRGNTVTLRAPFRKKSGGNTTPMFTLPVDMRPTLTVLQNVSSIDGIQGLFVINSNGEVWMQDLGSSSVTGKNFYITSTYVTN